jgi:hypothetical protein
MVTIPSVGGVVRSGYPTSINSAQGTWANAVSHVPAALTINVLATVPVRDDPMNPPNPNGGTHVVGSAWTSK